MTRQTPPVSPAQIQVFSRSWLRQLQVFNTAWSQERYTDSEEELVEEVGNEELVRGLGTGSQIPKTQSQTRMRSTWKRERE